jgi:deoxycytidylate deaminase
MKTPPADAIEQACAAARRSPCQSKRGAAIFLRHSGTLVSIGYNDQVEPFACDGSDACKRWCRFEAVHAEQAALVQADVNLQELPEFPEMLHVKVVGGQLVASGPPSCVACSKLIVAAHIAGMWLYHEHGWRRYDADEFHRLSVNETRRLASIR